MSLLKFKEMWKIQEKINSYSWDEEDNKQEFNIKRLKNQAIYLYRGTSKLFECFDEYRKNFKDENITRIRTFDCFYRAMSIKVLEDGEIQRGVQARMDRLWINSYTYNKQKKPYNIILDIVSLNGYMLSFFKPFESFEDYEIYYDILDANENIIGSLIELFVVLNFEKSEVLNMYKNKYKEIYG